MIRQARPEDARQLALIHAEALPGDLLPRLGMWFLARVFHPLALSSSHCFTLVHEMNGRVSGFVTFTHDTPAFARQLRLRSPAMLAAALGMLPRDPAVLAELARCAIGFESDTTAIGCRPDECPELFVIAVSSPARGSGTGRMLVREGLARLSRHAAAPLGCLVKTSSTAAFSFYIKQGFVQIGEERRGTRILQVLHHPLGHCPASTGTGHRIVKGQIQ